MSNCAGAHIGSICDLCDHSLEFDVWWLVDTSERPDLLAKIEAGTLHDAVCPECGHINRIHSDLLLYRPTEDPVLLFSPAETADLAAGRSGLESLIRTLKQKLGSSWREEWAKSVLGVQRSHLAFVIRQGVETLGNQEIPNEKPLRLIQEFIRAEQWDGARNFLLRNPSLLDKDTQQLFDQIVSRCETEGNKPAFAIFDEYRRLLQRCREIGIEAAINEKCNSSDSSSVPPSVT